MRIPFSKVSCNGNELKYIKEVIDSGWLTTASKARSFEEKVAEYVGAKYACAVNSCTAALHLALEAMGISEGDKVFVPDMTFTASAEVIRYLGGHPVFLDVEYGTCLITPEILENAIVKHPDVKTLVVVHFGGHAAEMYNQQGNGIVDICKRNHIQIIEDAAHAFPSQLGDKYVGNLGDVTCFSFYANKTITTGEGGMLVTNNEEIYKRANTMRLHGINRDVWGRFTTDSASWEYDVIAPGYKYNMPDINAAIGLAQLEKAESMREKRQKVVEFYYDELKDVDLLDLPVSKVPFKHHSWHIFHLVLSPDAPISRNELINKLAKEGIGTSVHYKPLHHMTYYREKYNLIKEDYPTSEQIWQNNFSLPLYPDLQLEECRVVCDSLKQSLGV